jgi:membrane protein
MSTRLFTQLRRSINHLWGVELLPGDGVKGTLRKQARKIVVSFCMVVLIEVVLLALVGVKTAVAVAMTGIGPDLHGSALWYAGGWLLSFGAVTLLFATMFRVLPDARIAWRDLWVGALVTALLFSIGASLISLYLRHKSAHDTFGDGGAIVMLLLWVNYSARIFFLGVSFTGEWAARRGRGIRPTEGARLVE